MIGKLKGVVDHLGEDSVILDVQGVGYEVHCPSRVLQILPKVGEVTTLSIETYVREDQIRLFGFSSEIERSWFRLLMTVQGVGAKVALAILGVLNSSDLANAIALQDKAQISRAPGVGKKVAERILAELKDKAPAFAHIDADAIAVTQEITDQRVAGPAGDAVSALVNLGYGQVQATAAVAAARREAGEKAGTQQLIRFALRELSQ